MAQALKLWWVGAEQGGLQAENHSMGITALPGGFCSRTHTSSMWAMKSHHIQDPRTCVITGLRHGSLSTAYCFHGIFSASTVCRCIYLIKDKTTALSNFSKGKLVGNISWRCKTSYCLHAPTTLSLKYLMLIYYYWLIVGHPNGLAGRFLTALFLVRHLFLCLGFKYNGL